MKGVSLLKTWDCQGIHIDEVNCSLFHIVSWDFEGRRNVTLLHGLIYMYFLLFIKISHYCHCLWYTIFIPCHDGFLFLLNLGDWWLDLNIAVLFRVIQAGGVCRKTLTDISCTSWNTYIWWHGHKRSRQGLNWATLAWSDVSPAVTSVKWVCSWGEGSVGFPCSWKPH